MTDDRVAHWQDVYRRKPDADLTWHQDDPQMSLALIAQTGLPADARIVDIGGGTSRLAAALLERGFSDVTVLDLSSAALERARQVLGPRGAEITWIAQDVTRWQPQGRFDLWHDRAAFHFLTDPADRAAYVARLTEALVPGGWAVIASFAADGPEKCSGLPVQRYDPADLARVLGPGFALIEGHHVAHPKPQGGTQAFQYSLFQRI